MPNTLTKIAYVDFDGTLVKSHCVNYLIQIQYYRKNKILFWLWRAWLQLKSPWFHYLNKTSAEKFDRYYYRYFKGIPRSDLEAAMPTRIINHLYSRLLPDAVDELQRLKHAGYHIVIVSASLKNIVEPFALAIGADDCLATEIEESDGVFTGNICGHSINHHNKRKAIEDYQQQRQLKPQHIVAYGNSQWDIPMLELAHQAIAINAGSKLREWVGQEKIKSYQWDLEKIPLRFHFLYPLLRPFIREQEGLQYIPRSGGVIIIANHSSYLDHYLIGLTVMCLYNRRVRFLAKKEHFEKTFERWIHEWLGAFPIDRNRPSKESLLNVVKLLNNNEIVLIYPEGTRSEDGQLQPFKPGVLFTHYQSSAPIVPAGINGAYRVLPRGAYIPRPARMGLRFGPPVCYAEPGRHQLPKGRERQQQLNQLREQVKYLAQAATLNSEND